MARQYERLLYERTGDKGEALWLTLNNEAKRNALDDTMQLELLEVFRKVAFDPEIRCVVLRGAGETAFCSGADIRVFQSLNHVSSYDYMLQRGNALQRLLTTMEKPVIAAVGGMCFAGGMELALMCDFIYATENATFGLLEINLGLLAGWGGTSGLSRAIPPRRAREMIYRGEVVSATEAKEWGLVNRVFPTRAALDAAVQQTVAEIAAKPPLALRAAKTIINTSLACTSLESVQAIERGLIEWLVPSEDLKEGVSAFLEKRKPQFRGR